MLASERSDALNNASVSPIYVALHSDAAFLGIFINHSAREGTKGTSANDLFGNASYDARYFCSKWIKRDRSFLSARFFFPFFTPFVPLHLARCCVLLRFAIQLCHSRCCWPGWFMESAFCPAGKTLVSQGGYRVALSPSRLFDIRRWCSQLCRPTVKLDCPWVLLGFNQLRTCYLADLSFFTRP